MKAFGQTKHEVVNLDALTYTGNLESLASVADHPRYHFEHVDIKNIDALKAVLEKHQPDAVIHLATESHVDRSIDGPADFILTNIVGTYNLLDVAKKYWEGLSETKKTSFVFTMSLQDEVYGDLGETGLFTEDTAYEPSSPYSASKASSDYLVHAWHRTYGFPVVVTNCLNNYGSYQFPEKLIQLITMTLKKVYRDPFMVRRTQSRYWLYVDGHSDALRLVLEKGKIAEIYNIGEHS